MTTKQTEKQDYFFDGEGLYEPMTISSTDEKGAVAHYYATRVALPPKQVHFLCIVCGKKTGDLSFAANDPRDIESMTPADFGFGETRCDDHPKGN